VNDKLIDAIKWLANDPEKANELKENIAKLGNTNADEIIANEILKTLNA
jgi:UDP-N-acetylglucosamine:LPS N-acetylglucosamine transferase